MKITSVIDNLDEELAAKLTELARTGRSRYEVVLDRIDGDGLNREIELHFRLVELTATQPVTPAHYAGGLDGGGPVMPLPPRKPELDVHRLAGLIARLAALEGISGHALGVGAEGETLADRIEKHLTQD